MSDELKPCPFCGCSDDLEHGYGTEDREGVPCYVYCSTCGAQGPWVYVPASLSVTGPADLEWNRRADLVDAEIERLRQELDVCRDAIEHAINLVDGWSDENNDDISQGTARATKRMLNEAIGKAVPRLLYERPEGQRFYGLRWREQNAEIERLRAEKERLQTVWAEQAIVNENRQALIMRLESELAAERQRARMPDDLADRLRAIVDFQGPKYTTKVLVDILEWHDRAGEQKGEGNE